MNANPIKTDFRHFLSSLKMLVDGWSEKGRWGYNKMDVLEDFCDILALKTEHF